MSSHWLPQSTSLSRLAQAPQQPAQPAPSLHTGWTIHQFVTEECRILEVFNNELSTHTPAAWIAIFEQRLSLWCQQQLQQSQRPLLSLVPSSLLTVRKLLLKRTGQALYRGLRHSQVGARGSLSVVPLLRVLDFSPIGSPLEVTQRRFVPSGRATCSSSVLCTLPQSDTFNWRVSDPIRVFVRFSFMSRITSARFHSQKKNCV